MNFGFCFNLHVALLSWISVQSDIGSLLICVDIEEEKVVSLFAVGVHQSPSIFKLLLWQ
jgi:hypothetical protein